MALCAADALNYRGIWTIQRRHAYGRERRKEVRASDLFVHGDVGEILQHGMRGDGEDAGYYVPVRASGL
jgi:hypothetical protein